MVTRWLASHRGEPRNGIWHLPLPLYGSKMEPGVGCGGGGTKGREPVEGVVLLVPCPGWPLFHHCHSLENPEGVFYFVVTAASCQTAS